jgi:hypothetical protein
MPSEPKLNKEFSMTQVWKLSAALLFIAAVAGCSSNSTCLREVETHPGMTCLDVGLGWYHAQFASQMPVEQSSGRDGAVSTTPSSSNPNTN